MASVRSRALVLAAACLLACAGHAATTAHATAPLRCGAVSVAVPAGWHARVHNCRAGLASVALATFPFAAGDNAGAELSARRMHRRDVLIVVLGYGSVQSTDGSAFARDVRLPLTIGRMTVLQQFEGVPDGHRLARKLFAAGGNAFDARVQFAAAIDPALARRADRLLRLVRFARAGG
jgi:hypothetical protein